MHKQDPFRSDIDIRSIVLARPRRGRLQQGSEQAAAPPPPAVTVATPTVRTVTDWDEFVGRFEAIQQVQIRARVGGFVDSIDFKDGTIVKAGDLLYVIDPRPYTAPAAGAGPTR